MPRIVTLKGIVTPAATASLRTPITWKKVPDSFCSVEGTYTLRVKPGMIGKVSFRPKFTAAQRAFDAAGVVAAVNAIQAMHLSISVDGSTRWGPVNLFCLRGAGGRVFIGTATTAVYVGDYDAGDARNGSVPDPAIRIENDGKINMYLDTDDDTAPIAVPLVFLLQYTMD